MAPTQQALFTAYPKTGDAGKANLNILPGNQKLMEMVSIREKTIQGLKVGDTFSIVRRFTENDIEQFRKITRDDNPVHFEGRFTEAKKFKGQICHGLLIGSMATEIGGQIGWLASSLRFDFKKPVYVNDVVTCRLTMTSINESLKAEAMIEWQNQHHEIVLTAHLSGILPNPDERRILQSIVQREEQPRGVCSPPSGNIPPKAGT
jgi:acyl dehydratase